MIASLPMYDWPDLRWATDALWAGIARHLGTHGGLERRADHTSVWRELDFVFSQTCGYPLTHGFCGRLTYVATPQYRADGCDGPNYCSILFAREPASLEAFRGRVAAVNNPDSMSGMLALKLVFAPLAEHGRFFGRAILSGGHAASIAAVREGRADICAIDAVCVAITRRYWPEQLAGLHEIGRSPFVPGLPFVTAPGRDATPLRNALKAAFADKSLAAAREALLLAGVSILAPGAYDRILDLEQAMEAQGGLVLLEDRAR
jgi:ABC-type phosphate/phosphonate transport system substrate-binding protein